MLRAGVLCQCEKTIEYQKYALYYSVNSPENKRVFFLKKIIFWY